MCLQARISPDPSRSTLPSRGWSASSRKTWRGALPGLVCISLRARLASAAQVDDLQEDQGLPDPEKDPKQEEGMEGMGDLGRNLEFMMMKIAQLDYFAGRGVVVSRSVGHSQWQTCASAACQETVVELQQLQIKDMNEWRKAHMSQEHNDTQQPPSTQEANKG